MGQWHTDQDLLRHALQTHTDMLLRIAYQSLRNRTEAESG